MYLIVGAGLSGCVIAERLSSLGHDILLIESRNHIGGNCYDYIDIETGIRVSKYGAHIFHTNNEIVWEYINKFCVWKRWEHKVEAYIEEDNVYVPVPCNLTTINVLDNKTFINSSEYVLYNYKDIKNSEEMALSRMPESIYYKIIKPYTYKQWEKFPIELDKSVLERLPFRNDFNPRYFNDKYQALPEMGYTYFCEQLLKNPKIKIVLNEPYNALKYRAELYEGIIFTGPIDAYFSDSNLPKLQYRTIDFKFRTFKNMNYYQHNSVINYPSLNFPYTRIVEYKHFLNQGSPHTIISYETTRNAKEDDEKYYPIPNETNKVVYDKYVQLSNTKKNIYFVGRLATYKYLNMDEAIFNALNIISSII